MSLLDSDDFTFHTVKGSNPLPPRNVDEEHAGPVPPSMEYKGRVRSGELNVDAQKMAGFSLRRKKDKDGEGKTHKKNKSLGKIQPPDSPKALRSGPSPNVRSSKKQQQYAHLLENELSSDDDEEEDTGDTFVLSRGHQAREKRSSFKSTSGGEGLFDASFNPEKTSAETSPIKTVTSTIGSAFPVSFTPPHQAHIPPLTSGTNMTTALDSTNLLLGLNETFVPEPIPVLPPPPPPHASAYQPVTQLKAPPTTNDDSEWSVNVELYEKCTSQFREMCPVAGELLSGEKARDFFLKSNLPVNELSKIW